MIVGEFVRINLLNAFLKVFFRRFKSVAGVEICDMLSAIPYFFIYSLFICICLSFETGNN